MAYARPQGSHSADFARAREVEEQVGEWLGHFKVGNLEATDRLDWWVPGLFLDVKEKWQKLSRKWTRHFEWDETNAFIVDELSVRRAAQHFPHAYFIIHDRPGGKRWFLARIDEMFCAERVRLDRTNPNTGHKKGKWVVNLQNFRELPDPASQLLPTVLEDQIAMPWKWSQCISGLEIGEV